MFITESPFIEEPVSNYDVNESKIGDDISETTQVVLGPDPAEFEAVMDRTCPNSSYVTLEELRQDKNYD